VLPPIQSTSAAVDVHAVLSRVTTRGLRAALLRRMFALTVPVTAIHDRREGTDTCRHLDNVSARDERAAVHGFAGVRRAGGSVCELDSADRAPAARRWAFAGRVRYVTGDDALAGEWR
jgi:hypothetical protein